MTKIKSLSCLSPLVEEDQLPGKEYEGVAMPRGVFMQDKETGAGEQVKRSAKDIPDAELMSSRKRGFTQSTHSGEVTEEESNIVKP